MESFNRIFGVTKPVIAMLHLPALPGRPLHDRVAGIAAAVDSVARDLAALQDAGVDGVLFCNEADLPYQLEVGPEIAAYRAAIGADGVALFDNIAPEFASAVGTRGVAERAKGAAFLGMDAILISGPAAGVPFEMSDLRAAKDAAPDVAVIANTGVRADRIAEIFKVADGVIVGTSLKVDGHTWNAVDPDRARRLMEAARSARSSTSTGA